MHFVTRRRFLQSAAAGVAAACALPAGAAERPVPSAARLPRWRGFNLLEKFVAEQKGPFLEEDFATIADWGFDFVRLPMDYRCWASQTAWLELDEAELKEIDAGVELGRQYGVHVSLNFHRAPGYSVNKVAAEPVSLWEDEKAQEAFSFHWRHFAERYRGIPSTALSFDLVNEPAQVSEETYVRVAMRAIEAIRAADPDRLIISDGLQWGRKPVKGLAQAGVAQSTRGYEPFRLTHYQASWVNGADTWETPAWPFTYGGETWDKERLRETTIAPWKELEALGVGVHVGEWGAFNRTPHAVVLAWMRDALSLWAEAGWGWALWNLRGSFGPLDSQRADVAYETSRGHQLDRAMLELMRSN
ncbi:MAG: cellulase family glycosylhydrolase [Candidatus Hydrogenedentes bacterium]|nr:cellulase family glycosylhydrolase [Candidatus Hydrogenedentota bacterium]